PDSSESHPSQRTRRMGHPSAGLRGDAGGAHFIDSHPPQRTRRMGHPPQDSVWDTVPYDALPGGNDKVSGHDLSSRSELASDGCEVVPSSGKKTSALAAGCVMSLRFAALPPTAVRKSPLSDVLRHD